MDHIIPIRLATVPAATPGNSCQWSTDGQLAVLTRTAIHIFTPQVGQVSGLNQEYSTHFHRTKVDIDKDVPPKFRFASFQYPEQDPDIRCSALVNEYFKHAVWSPSGCSKKNGCVLLALTTSHAVIIIEPLGDPALQEWRFSLDLSDKILAHYQETERDIFSNVKMVDKLETTGIAWSPMHHIYQPNLQPIRTSFIVTGNKNGTLLFWRWKDNDCTYTNTIQFDPVAWVQQMVFSEWTHSNVADTGYYTSFLTVTLSTGAVYLILLRLDDKGNLSLSEPQLVISPDNRYCSAVVYDNDLNAVVLSKANRIYMLQGFAVDTQGNIDITNMQQNMVKLPSFTMPVSSIVVEELGQYRIFAVDGTQHRISPFAQSIIPTQTDARIQTVISSLPRLIESQAKTTPQEADDDDNECELTTRFQRGLSIYGSVVSKYGGFLLLHCALSQRQELVYKTETSSPTWIMMIRVKNEPDLEFENHAMEKLKKLLSDENLLCRRRTRSLLWDLADHCCVVGDPTNPASLLYQVIATPQDVINSAQLVALMQNCSFEMLWYQNRLLNVLRVNNYLLHNTRHRLLKTELAETAKLMYQTNNLSIQRTYVQLVLYFCYKELSSMPLQRIDSTTVTSLLLMIDYVFWDMQGYASSFLETTKQLLELLMRATDMDLFQERAVLANYLMNGDLTMLQQERIKCHERCAACDADILFTDAFVSKCANNHSWKRCSMTLLSITSPHCLTCSNCAKQIVRWDQVQPKQTKSSTGKRKRDEEEEEEESEPLSCLGKLVANVQFCVYCGCSLV